MDMSGLDASEVLAAALEQMDGIIASTKFEYQNGGFGSNGAVKITGRSQNAWVIKLCEDLKFALEMCEDRNKILTQVPRDSVTFFRDWLTIDKGHGHQVNGFLTENADDRVQKLESDKQSLMLQVNVLTEQVDAQGEKIHELELHVDEKRDKLLHIEEMLQSELLTRSSQETYKLDLMAEISSLKIKLASVDKDRKDLDDKFKIAQRQIAELEGKLILKESEISDLKSRLTKNGTVLAPPTTESNDYEVEKLKKAVEALVTSNDEKDKRIDDLRRLLRRYKKIEELVLQAQGRKALEELIMNIDDDTSSTSSTTPSVGECLVRDGLLVGQTDNMKLDIKSYLPNPSATSTPANTPQRRSAGIVKSNSAEDLTGENQKLSTATKTTDGFNSTHTGNYGTLPKDRNREDDREHRRSRGFPTLGKTLLRIRSGKRCSSAPNLAHTEVVTDDEDGLQHIDSTLSSTQDGKKKKGLRKFFGRLKRSSSQDFHDREQLEDFRRGGVRATATARLGWSVKNNNSDPETPFNRWDGDRVTAWMNDIGLNMYLIDCRRWVKNGEHLMRASPHELEKELGIKNSLHRKKLHLALQAVTSAKKDRLGDLDHHWVTRWLDDIGLPQYKDQFYDCRVDGRMLHYMTVDDLLALKVVNELHHISLKRGIQVLRLNGYNPQCLKRRPSPEEGHLLNIPGEVVLWTNHRVMEWLRTIDLSEYAPNLRGSGVHGALLILEPRFNSELFSQLLSIPQSKTLLRRHLSTHFVALIGNDTQLKKRECESCAGYSPLVLNAKIKARGKFGLFGHKRSKSETEADGFICPLDIAAPINTVRNGSLTVPPAEMENGKRDDKAVNKIGAYSKEINTLTDMLAHENFLENVPTSNV
ncbi:hypothetical protein ScPMuIL_016310 [Solemya velum]